MKSAAPTPPDVRASVCRDFVGVLQEWVRTLERDERALLLRGNYRFAADVGRMRKQARHVLEVVTE